MAGTGHNANGKLQSIVDRIESVEATIKEHRDEIKEIFEEAKSDGLEVKIIRNVLRLRKQDAETRERELAMLDTYMHALGMLSDTPLGKAAIERAGDELDVRKTVLNRT